LANSIKSILIPVLAALCLLVSIVLQPWSELGFNGNFPNWLSWAMTPLGVASMFKDIPWGQPIETFLKAQGAKANFGDYAYSLFMCMAMTAAAIAIVLVGKEDAEEKTVLPLKK
jgi:hypothetical protein